MTNGGRNDTQVSIGVSANSEVEMHEVKNGETPQPLCGVVLSVFVHDGGVVALYFTNNSRLLCVPVL